MHDHRRISALFALLHVPKRSEAPMDLVESITNQSMIQDGRQKAVFVHVAIAGLFASGDEL
jgi:hypothetical protein